MPKVIELYAFVVQEGPDPENEGIIGELAPNGTWVPFIGSDMKRVESLIPRADQIAVETGRPYKILKFKLDQVIEKPVPPNPNLN